jgi:hypothetical protein
MSIAAIAVVSLCLCSLGLCAYALLSENLRPENLGVASRDNHSLFLPASHDNSGRSKHLLCWLLTVLPFSQSLALYFAHDLPACMSAVPFHSSLHYCLRFHGSQVLEEKGVETESRWWPGDTGSRIRLLSQSTRGN